MILILLLLYLVPLSTIALGTWLVWRLARLVLPRGLAALLAIAPLLLIMASEEIPAARARRIAQDSAADVSNSVAADSILFGTAQSASEAMADEPASLRFTEGVLERPEGRSWRLVPTGLIRFSGVRRLAPGAACRPDEVEEWVAGVPGATVRKCVAWAAVDRPAAKFEAFINRFVHYRSGPFRVTEQQQGLLRRADGRTFNIDKTVDVSGGVWRHLRDGWFDVAGLSDRREPGHHSSTFDFVPREEYLDFAYRGALRGRAAAPSPPEPANSAGR